MGVPDFSVVLGVDFNHLAELKLVLPNWKKFKPSLFSHPWFVFYDKYDTLRGPLERLVWEYQPEARFVEWPLKDVLYEHDASSRFGDGQRYKMLSGFVHVPARHVTTPYWLKLDLDVLSNGKPDWIREDWFEGNPAIVASSWGYSKPANILLKLDEWAEKFNVFRSDQPPLNLIPNPGSDLIRHKRIISWCGFFHTEFTRMCSNLAEKTCGIGQLPVPSQDTYMHYMAKRGNHGIVRTNMKNCGFVHCSRESQIRKMLEQQECQQ